MFYFVSIIPDNGIRGMMIAGKDLFDAYDKFITEQWQPTMTSSIAVFQGQYLCARITTVVNNDTGETKPYLQEW